MYILAPVAWPTAKLLDQLLGEDHGTVYKKAGLKTLVTLHKTLGPSPSDRLNQDEVTIISAVLDLKDKSVGSIMTPMEDVFTISSDTILDEKTMNIILSAGYSRIPIHTPDNPHNFVGMLLVKILITYDPEDAKRVGEFALATLPETRPETSCLDIVNFFQEGKAHMVLVSDSPGEDYGALGVVTLEDVIEELIGEEIIDESDVYIDVHKAIRRIAPAPKTRIPKGNFVSDTEIHRAVDDILIDFSEDHSKNNILTERTDSHNNDPDLLRPSKMASAAMSDYGSSPKAIFLRRSTSSGGGDPISVRGNVAEMREHLKHLGPSNLASRPKRTRYNNVKIKPGGGGASDVAGLPESRRRQASLPEDTSFRKHAPQGDVGAALLGSGGLNAKDGVQAVKQDYGSMDRASPLQVPINQDSHPSISNKATEANTESSIPQSSSEARYIVSLTLNKSTTSLDNPKKLHSASASVNSTSTVGSLHPNRSTGDLGRTIGPGKVRSGSITENIINTGGFQKVVLEMTSSSEDTEEQPPADRKEDQQIGSESQIAAGTGQGEGSDKKKKKSRRRKKRSKAGNSEVAPLLRDS
jgi:metal transporter CNNM